MKLLFVVLLFVFLFFVVLVLVVEILFFLLLGCWLLDIVMFVLFEVQCLKYVVFEFKDVGGGCWSLYVDIVLYDGKIMKFDGMLVLDGMLGFLFGIYGVDKVNLKLLVLNMLVMQLVDYGMLVFICIYIVVDDQVMMIEIKVFYGYDGMLILQINLFKCMLQ